MLSSSQWFYNASQVILKWFRRENCRRKGKNNETIRHERK